MDFLFNFKKSHSKGFSLIETLVAVSIFVLVSVAIYSGFTHLMKGLKVLEIKNLAINLANEKIEIVRNLPYDDVGLIEGLPEGNLIPNENVIRGGVEFNVITTIRYFDDPIDGTIDGDPTDDSPNDYKIVQFDISCLNCVFEETISLYTKVVPGDKEVSINAGAIFIRVLDSYGKPIQGANIKVFSDKSTSTININEVSDAEGFLKIYDVPPGIEAYEIEVTKNGYSSEKTYTSGDPSNPIPSRSHLDVLAGKVTSASFQIDKLSYLSLRTRRPDCSVVSNVDFNIHGSKLIGYKLYKYDSNLNSGSSGRIDIDNIEWDNYSIIVNDNSYQLYGASTILPIRVNPDTNQNVNLIIGPNDPNMLLVQVQDTATGLPLSGAVVTLSGSGYSETIITGNGFINQTDWSGGPGQTDFVNKNQFHTSDNNIDYSTPNKIVLDKFGIDYVSDGYLESSIINLGTTSNFLTINWLNQSHPEGTAVKIQLASNEIVTPTTTWNFIGPDGNSASYYTNSGYSIYSGHNGDQYLKYKVFLESNNNQSTPLISDINFTYAFDCVAPGQVLFSGLSSGEYQLIVERDGYQIFQILDLIINEPWKMVEIKMTE